jgi:hypothetical protein
MHDAGLFMGVFFDFNGLAGVFDFKGLATAFAKAVAPAAAALASAVAAARSVASSRLHFRIDARMRSPSADAEQLTLGASATSRSAKHGGGLRAGTSLAFSDVLGTTASSSN